MQPITRKYVLKPCMSDSIIWRKKCLDSLIGLTNQKIESQQKRLKGLNKKKKEGEKVDHEIDVVKDKIKELKKKAKILENSPDEYIITNKDVKDYTFDTVRYCMESEARRKNYLLSWFFSMAHESRIDLMERKDRDKWISELLKNGYRIDGAKQGCVFDETEINNILGSYGVGFCQNLTALVKRLVNDEDLLNGGCSLTNFKSDSPFYLRHSEFEIININGSYYLNYGGNKQPHIFKFKVDMGYGKNRKELECTMNRICSGEYECCDSKLGIEKNDVMLYLSLNIPDKDNTLYDEICVGVDLGMAIPAYVSLNTKPYVRKAIGDYNHFIKMKTQIANQRKRLQKNLTLGAGGGHGRKKKLKPLDRFRDYESNWTKNYNHRVSKAIVDFAVKNNAKVIKMENLKGFGKDKYGKSNASYIFALRNWTYYQLQQFIEYKAAMNGIEVKYVNPYNTSRRCSCCGYEDSNNRVSQKKFKCLKCGNEMNADHNASINIARSEEYQNGDVTLDEQRKQHFEYLKNLAKQK